MAIVLFMSVLFTAVNQKSTISIMFVKHEVLIVTVFLLLN